MYTQYVSSIMNSIIVQTLVPVKSCFKENLKGQDAGQILPSVTHKTPEGGLPI